MFVDSTVVTFAAGKGGDGCVSFRREKFVPRGGPNGGDGGSGGDIILVSGVNAHSLVDLKFQKIVKSPKGANGTGSNKTGRGGQNRIVNVPPGTIVKTYPDEKLLFDFTKEGMEFVIAKGGRGGLGNSHFKSSVHQTPKFSQPGEDGESITVVVELKLIAFAGLVGLPNAGKSTLISKISSAKPKIADYPFTTLFPNLGVVYNDFDSLVVADIPGIIEGAHQGEGMGLNFLKHIERNKVLIFIVDISPYTTEPPLETLKMLQQELKFYKSALARKKILVLGNKIDLMHTPEDNPEHHQRVKDVADYCASTNTPYLEISAAKSINLAKLKATLFKLHHGKD
ncbi:MAG: GTPase ObgE [bacterium]|nr:GTPase ObgE [bacterium]